MKVTTDMIHPDLRQRGKWMQRLQPKLSAWVVKRMGQLSQKSLRGKYNGPNSMREVWIPREDGSQLRICVFRPRVRKQTSIKMLRTGSHNQWDAPDDGVPGLLWLHGGGFAVGAPEQDSSYIDAFIKESGAVVVAPDYRLSGEAPYPAALDDAYLALEWMRDNAVRYGIRSDQLFVGGDSAGGGLTAALTLLARDRGNINIAFQMPLYPMLDNRSLTYSARDNNAPVWNTHYNEVAWDMYLAGLGDSETDIPPYAVPVLAKDYTNLPPTYTYVGTIEPFFDETMNYISNLIEAGIPVHFKLYEGAYHGFDIIQPNANISKQARAHLMATYKYAVKNYFAEQSK